MPINCTLGWCHFLIYAPRKKIGALDMSVIELKSFRADMMRLFPDAPALAKLPVLSAESELLVMSAVAKVWDASSVPKTHTLPFAETIKRAVPDAIKQPFQNLGRVLADFPTVLQSRKIPAIGVAGGSSIDSRGDDQVETTVKTITADDPYSLEKRMADELSDSAELVSKSPRSGEFMQASLKQLEQLPPVRNYLDADKQAVVIVNNGAIDKIHVELTPPEKSAWVKIIRTIVAAAAFAASLVAVEDRFSPYLYAETHEQPGSETEQISEATEIAEVVACLDGIIYSSPTQVTAVGTTSGLVIRPEPGTGPQIGSFMAGDQATLLSQVGDYAKIRYWDENGQHVDGWIVIYETDKGANSEVVSCYLERIN